MRTLISRFMERFRRVIPCKEISWALPTGLLMSVQLEMLPFGRVNLITVSAYKRDESGRLTLISQTHITPRTSKIHWHYWDTNFPGGLDGIRVNS
jgi:hypothetical protein